MNEIDARTLVMWLLDTKHFFKTLAEDGVDHGVVFRPNGGTEYFIARYTEAGIVTVEYWKTYSGGRDCTLSKFGVYSDSLKASLEMLYVTLCRKRAQVKLEAAKKSYWFALARRLDPDHPLIQ